MHKATLENMLSHEVQILSVAEAQIASRLTQLASSVPAGHARDILNEQVKHSETRIALLRPVLDKLAGAVASRASCVGIRALLDEVEGAAKADLEPNSLNAEMALGVQRIKEYQLAGYQAVQTYAAALGSSQDLKPLEDSITADQKTIKNLAGVSHGLSHQSFVEDLLAHETLVLAKSEDQLVRSFGPTATFSNIDIRAQLQQIAAGGGGASSAASCIGLRALLDEVESAADSDLEWDAKEAEVTLGTHRARQYQAAGYNAIQGYAKTVGKDANFIAPIITASQQDAQKFDLELRVFVG